MNNIANNFNPPKEDIDNLLCLYKNGKFQDVLDKSKQLVSQYSHSIFLYNLRGSANALLKRFDKAEECYNKALRVKPDYAAAYNNLGNILKEKCDKDLAIKNYKSAIKLKPNCSEYHNNIGIIYNENNMIGFAIQSFKQAIFLKPDYAEAYYGLGLSLEKNGEFRSAIKSYESALIYNPNYPEVFFELGNIYAKKGDYNLSIENYLNAIKIKKNYYEAYCNLGNSMKDLGDIRSARFYYNKGLKINSKDFEAIWNRHGVSFSIDEAIKWLLECLKAESNCLKAKLMLAALKYLKNDKTDFNNLMKTDIKEHPYMRSFNWIFKLQKPYKLFFNKFSLIDYVIENSLLDRAFYEFGVWKGVSFKYFMKFFKKGFGFDTFTGLPEDWYDEKEGTYSSDGSIPKVKGGEFIIGNFKDTLPKYFNKKRPLASIINFDADLYSSTLCVLENCKKIIDKNTILIFDEFLMNPKWEEDEYRALNEFCVKYNLSYQVIAVSFFSKQVAVRIENNR